MKVCTCLNPLHTVLAIYGCMMGYTRISDEMKNPDLKAFVEQVGYVEGMPVVVDPGIINAQDFIKTTINVRFPNPFVPDTPQRIATDTSKIPVRFEKPSKRMLPKGSKTFVPGLFHCFLPVIRSIRQLLTITDNHSNSVPIPTRRDAIL